VGCRSKDAWPESCTIHVEFLSAIGLINKQQVHVSPVSVAERDSQPTFLDVPSKNIIRFTQITELVLGSLGGAVAPFAPVLAMPLISLAAL